MQPKYFLASLHRRTMAPAVGMGGRVISIGETVTMGRKLVVFGLMLGTLGLMACGSALDGEWQSKEKATCNNGSNQRFLTRL